MSRDTPKEQKVLIHSPEVGYLDGFDNNGVDEWFEWTPNKKTAWRMWRDEAERRLAKIILIHPDAKIID